MDECFIPGMPMPAMHGLMEVWAVLSDSDKSLVSDFFKQWTALWIAWRGMMAPGQPQNFAAHVNIELLEQVAAFKRLYAKQLAVAYSNRFQR